MIILFLKCFHHRLPEKNKQIQELINPASIQVEG